MFKNLLRTLIGFVIGLFASFGLIFGVEIVSNFLHPFPSDFRGSSEEICMHVARYPAWILAGVVVAWGLTAAIGTWIAGSVGNVVAATALGLLLVAGVVLNISMLPYPVWFKVLILIVVPAAALLSTWIGLSRD